MKAKPLCMSLLLALGVAACSHERPIPPDSLQLPQHFSQSGVGPLPAQFWQAFNDTALNSLVQTALRQNHSLEAKRQALAQAEALLQQQRASLWPSLNLSAGASRVSGDGVDTATTYSSGLAASYEVDLWGRVRSAADAAALEKMASAADLKAAEITLAADVSSLWFQLLAQRGLQRLQQQQIETNDKVLQLIMTRFEQGQADAADVLRQQVLLESNRAALESYHSAIEQLEHALAVLVGTIPAATDTLAGDQLPPLAELPNTGLTSDWLQGRPDIMSAQYAMQAADANLASAIAERFPRLDLTASISSTAPRASDLFDDWLKNIAANLVLPIIDGGSRRAVVARNEAIFRQQFALYQQAVLTAVAEVEDALSREHYQKLRMVHLQQKLALGNQVVERLSLRYRSGAADYLDVLQALTDQQQTEQDMITAQQQLLEYRLALARALATGWTSDEPTLP